MGVGKEIKEEEGGGEATEESSGAEGGEWCVCLFLPVFEFIKCVTYLSTNYEDINFWV